MEITLTKDNYAEIVEKADRPVLIDFWATWCGPCKMLAPVIAEIAEKRADVVVCKVNVDEEEELAVRFGIRVIPTLVRMKDGKEAGRTQGYLEYDDVNAFLDA